MASAALRISIAAKPAVPQYRITATIEVGPSASLPARVCKVFGNTPGGSGTFGDSFNVQLQFTPFEVVPVPPAVWLFGSAVGVMGWLRRRAG